MSAPTVLRSTPVDREQEAVARFEALHPEQVDASVVTYTRSPYDWCQHARGCDEPADCTVSGRDLFSGRWLEPTEYCLRHGLATARWLLMDEALPLAQAPSVGVEVWRVAAGVQAGEPT